MRQLDAVEASRIFLGIDPGLRVTGYGIVRHSRGDLVHVDHGCIRTNAPDRAGRLVQIHAGICEILDRWTVDEVALEKQFVAINPSSAFAIGEARAVAMLATAQRAIPIFEYAPAEVKQSVTSYGRGSKQQIQEMVRLQFALPELPRPADAADALAIAICHAARRRIPAPARTQAEARIARTLAGR